MIKKNLSQDRASADTGNIRVSTGKKVNASDPWKKTSLILGVLLAMSVICLIYQAGGANEPVEAYKKHDLAEFVKNIRCVSSDPVVIRSQLETAYSFTTHKGKKQLDKMIKDSNLEEKLSRQITATVNILSIKRKGDARYTVQWDETEYEGSKEISKQNFEAFFRLKFKIPKSSPKSAYQLNPSGLYVNNFVINKRSKTEPEL